MKYRKWKRNQVEFMFESLKKTVKETGRYEGKKKKQALSPGSYQTVVKERDKENR